MHKSDTHTYIYIYIVHVLYFIFPICLFNSMKTNLITTLSALPFPNIAGHNASNAAQTYALRKKNLKTDWQCHPAHALVESATKCQALKSARQGYLLHTLVEPIAKSQALKSTWQGHLLHTLVEIIAKCQALKSTWQGHLLVLWLNSSPNDKL